MRFCLDENLPHYVAKALGLVSYQIDSSFRLGLDQWDDPDIIAWLAGNDYVWITKDEAAKREWLTHMLGYGLSVVWVLGLNVDGNAGNIPNGKKLLHMLSAKLERISSLIEESPTPLYLELGIRVNDRVFLKNLTESR